MLTLGTKLTHIDREDIVIKAMTHKNSKILDEILSNQSKIEQFKSTIEEIQISFESFKSQSITINKNEVGKLKPKLERVKNQLDNIVLDKELINSKELERSLKDQAKKTDDLGKNIKEMMHQSLKECSNTYENQIKELSSQRKQKQINYRSAQDGTFYSKYIRI